jgi:E3 ubiquitin-protein ligase HACE1
LEVAFIDEAAGGAGLRRDWLTSASAELVSTSRGLFNSLDGGRSYFPNVHSEVTVGADHLSYFWLVGRLVGFALYHKEPLGVALSQPFLKAVVGLPIVPDDIELVDPILFQNKVLYLRQISVANLDLYFVDEKS